MNMGSLSSLRILIIRDTKKLKKFLYKFGLVSILSFFFSNLLFYFFEGLFIPSIASFITIVIVFFINTQLFFKTKLFNKSKSNYYKLLILTISFRVFEFLLFNVLYLFILLNLKSNYIFLITLIISFSIKTIVYYKSSESKKKRFS